MSSDISESKSRKHLSDMQEARRRVHERRDVMRREMAANGIASKKTKAEFGAAIADYQDLLETYQNEAALQDPWDGRLPIDNLDEKLVETFQVSETVNPATGRTETHDYPVLVQHHGSALINHSKELDAVFKELGFAAPAKDKTEVTEASEDDLAGLLSARGQTEALENLPDHFLENVETDLDSDSA